MPGAAERRGPKDHWWGKIGGGSAPVVVSVGRLAKLTDFDHVTTGVLQLWGPIISPFVQHSYNFEHSLSEDYLYISKQLYLCSVFYGNTFHSWAFMLSYCRGEELWLLKFMIPNTCNNIQSNDPSIVLSMWQFDNSIDYLCLFASSFAFPFLNNLLRYTFRWIVR